MTIKKLKAFYILFFNKGKKLCKLYSCNAEIWGYMGILVLVSYGTPIAVYTRDGSLYDCLRVVYGYTATSSQHISKFKKWLAEKTILSSILCGSQTEPPSGTTPKPKLKEGSTRQCGNMIFGIIKIWDIACVFAMVISGKDALSIIALSLGLCDIG